MNRRSDPARRRGMKGTGCATLLCVLAVLYPKLGTASTGQCSDDLSSDGKHKIVRYKVPGHPKKSGSIQSVKEPNGRTALNFTPDQGAPFHIDFPDDQDAS